MAETTVNLGMLPKNRGEYSSAATYYKDNIVQYNGSSYICTAAMDLEHPSGITGVAPYDSDPTQPNTGWAVFVNNQGGADDGIYDVSANHVTDNQPKVYPSLSAALNDIPAAKQKGGMEIRFIFNNSDYAVDKEEGLTTQPAGTLITSSPTMVDGTYKAAQLLGYFSTLPTDTGDSNAVVYYKEVDGTYTTWTITLQNIDHKYVQYRLMADSWSVTPSDWQGVDDWPTDGSDNLVKSGGIDYNIKKLSNKNIEPVLGYYIKKNGTVVASYNHIKTIVKAGDIVVFSGNNSNSSYCYTAALIPDDGRDTIVIVETGAASNFVYKVTTDGTLYVNFSDAYLATSYLKFTNPEYELINELYAESGNVTYDDDGNILSYPVKWSSGATGTYTNTDWDSSNNMYKGYEITYGTLMKLVQPAVTVSNGKITNIPNKTIVEL